MLPDWFTGCQTRTNWSEISPSSAPLLASKSLVTITSFWAATVRSCAYLPSIRASPQPGDWLSHSVGL